MHPAWSVAIPGTVRQASNGLEPASPDAETTRSLPALRGPSLTGIRDAHRRLVLHLNWERSVDRFAVVQTLRLLRPAPKASAPRCFTPDPPLRGSDPFATLKDGYSGCSQPRDPPSRRCGFDQHLRWMS